MHISYQHLRLVWYQQSTYCLGHVLLYIECTINSLPCFSRVITKSFEKICKFFSLLTSWPMTPKNKSSSNCFHLWRMTITILGLKDCSFRCNLIHCVQIYSCMYTCTMYIVFQVSHSSFNCPMFVQTNKWFFSESHRFLQHTNVPINVSEPFTRSIRVTSWRFVR